MKSRRLGAHGPTVSAIGLGAGSATTNFGDRDGEVQIETMQRALDLGVTFFDTADRYMKGRHEHLLGRALKGRRDQVILASKFGNFDLPGGRKGYNGKPEYVPQACEASLKNLGVDCIDLYYLHRIDPEVPIEDTVGAMAKLVREGKVRWLGLSEAGPRSLERACKVHPITALQTEYSLWTRDPEDEILATTRELGIGFVAYSPLGRGFLTGQIKSPEDLDASDYRRNAPRFLGGNFQKNLDLVVAVAEMAEEKRCTPAQLALAWVLAQGSDVVPIPGTKRPRYIAENIGALALTLTPADLQRLNDTFPHGAAAGERYGESALKAVNR